MGFIEEVTTEFYGKLYCHGSCRDLSFTISVTTSNGELIIDVKVRDLIGSWCVSYLLITSPKNYTESVHISLPPFGIGSGAYYVDDGSKCKIEYNEGYDFHEMLVNKVLDELESLFLVCDLTHYNSRECKSKIPHAF